MIGWLAFVVPAELLADAAMALDWLLSLVGNIRAFTNLPR